MNVKEIETNKFEITIGAAKQTIMIDGEATFCTCGKTQPCNHVIAYQQWVKEQNKEKNQESLPIPMPNEDIGEYVEEHVEPLPEENNQDMQIQKYEPQEIDVAKEEKRLLQIMEFSKMVRKLGIRSMNSPRDWCKWKTVYRPVKRAVNRLMFELGMSAILSPTNKPVMHKKEDGSITWVVTYKIWFTKIPDSTLERSGAVNSNERFYQSQIEADANEFDKDGKPREKWQVGRKFGKNATAANSLDQNVYSHSETRGLINAFCARLGIDGLTAEDLLEYGVFNKQQLATKNFITSPY